MQLLHSNEFINLQVLDSNNVNAYTQVVFCCYMVHGTDTLQDPIQFIKKFREPFFTLYNTN